MSNDVHADPTAAVFNAFIQASDALKRLPAVEAELEQHKAALEAETRKFHDAINDGADLAYQLKLVRATLAQREAELAQATKSHTDLAKVMDTIRGAVGNVASGLSDGAKVLTQVATGSGPSDADPTAPLTDNLSAQTHVQDKGTALGSNIPDHNPAPEVATPSDPNPSDPTAPSAPTMTEPSTHTEAPRQTEQAESSPNTNSGTNVAEDRELQGEVGTTGDQASGIMNTAGSPTSGCVDTTDLPHANRPYWDKPSEMSHTQWESLGGNPAPWRQSDK